MSEAEIENKNNTENTTTKVAEIVEESKTKSELVNGTEEAKIKENGHGEKSEEKKDVVEENKPIVKPVVEEPLSESASTEEVKATEIEKPVEEVKVALETVTVRVEEKKEDEKKEEEEEEEEKPTKSTRRGKKPVEEPVKKTPKPKAKKEEKIEKNQIKEAEESEKEEEESEEKQKSLPLYEQPLTVEGKRQRKSTQRLEIQVHEAQKVEIINGGGVKLGDIPRVAHFMEKHSVEDLKHLYRVCFNSQGRKTEIRKLLRQFSGFNFEKDTDAYNKKKESLEKTIVANLKIVCEILDLEKGGTKEEVIDRILGFLLTPTDSGKELPKTPAAKKRKLTTTKSSKKQKKDKEEDDEQEEEEDEDIEESIEEEEKKDEDKLSEKSETNKKTNKKAADEEHANKNGKDKKDEVDEEEDEQTEEEEDEDDEDDDKKKTKKSKAKTPSKSKKAKTPTKTPAKTPTKAAKTPAKKAVVVTTPATKRKRNVEEEKTVEPKVEENKKKEADEPTNKKLKTDPPTDDEIKKYIEELLKTSDLENITMKNVVKDVFAKYQGHNLNNKKDLIKDFVKELIN